MQINKRSVTLNNNIIGDSASSHGAQEFHWVPTWGPKLRIVELGYIYFSWLFLDGGLLDAYVNVSV